MQLIYVNMQQSYADMQQSYVRDVNMRFDGNLIVLQVDIFYLVCKGR